MIHKFILTLSCTLILSWCVNTPDFSVNRNINTFTSGAQNVVNTEKEIREVQSEYTMPRGADEIPSDPSLMPIWE